MTTLPANAGTATDVAREVAKRAIAEIEAAMDRMLEQVGATDWRVGRDFTKDEGLAWEGLIAARDLLVLQVVNQHPDRMRARVFYS